MTPREFLSLPLFHYGNALVRKCHGALALRIFKKADQVICRQGAAGVSAYFILSAADVYGLFAYIETQLQTAQAKLRTAPAEKLRDYVNTLQTNRDAYRAKLLFLNDDDQTKLLKAAHEADVGLAERCRKPAKGEEGALYRRLLTASAADKRAHADKVKKTDPMLADDWYAVPAAGIGDKELTAWRTRSTPPRGWLACSLPLAFDLDFRDGLAAAARPPRASGAISPDETLCFWRTFSVPSDRQDWDGHTQNKKQPRRAVVCDLCHTLPGGPACIRACPHNATLRFDARGGVSRW